MGIAVDKLDMVGAVNRISGYIRQYKGAVARGAAMPSLAHVVTANSEIAMMAIDNPELAGILAKAAMVVADGIGLVLGARILGNPVPERVPGIDLAGQLMAVCAREGWRPYLLGAAPGVAEEAQNVLEQRYPGLQIAGLHHGYFTPEQAPAVVAAINTAKPDILLVALGAPRQEKWIDANRQSLQVPVAIGVGGSLDGWAGRVQRAPQWMQNAGLEWTYRLLRQPSRALRMTALPRFAGTVLLHRLLHGKARG